MTSNELIRALGPLASLYTDRNVMEILVDAPNRVLVEREGKLVDAEVQFDSSGEIRKVIDNLLAVCGVTLQPGETVGDMRLPDSSNRALVVLPPTALNGPTLVIHKWNSNPISWEDLLRWGALTQGAGEFLTHAMQSQVSTLVTGGTGSGKTSFANRLAELIPATERLVVVEAAHEMLIRHPRALFLEANEPAHLSLIDLLTTASKMRPDWLITGELTGPEAMRAIQLMSRGHTGMTTLHANNPEDALARLEAMCLMAHLGLGLGEIRLLIASALQLITCQHKLDKTGKRRITHITELRGLENERYILQPLFRYNYEKDRLEPTGVAPSWG